MIKAKTILKTQKGIFQRANNPITCFGQQPCGFFPKRFLVSKINTARKLQKEIGGKIVFFYHDSDADYRETITVMKDLQSGEEARLNFTQENKLQKKHSPLFLKRIPKGWKEETLRLLPRFINKDLINLFSSVNEKNAADFCLKMYEKLGLLDGIDIARSSDASFREKANDLFSGFYADVEFQSEIVRAKISFAAPVGAATSRPHSESKIPNTIGQLHEGGNKYTTLQIRDKIKKNQITPRANQRLAWMQSVINCTHYVFGEGEARYLKFQDFPKIKFIQREKIENPCLAWIPS